MGHAGPLNQGEDFGFLSDVDTSRGHRGEEERHLTLAVTWRLKDAMRAGTPERSLLQWFRQEMMEARTKEGKRVRCHTFMEDGAVKIC